MYIQARYQHHRALQEERAPEGDVDADGLVAEHAARHRLEARHRVARDEGRRRHKEDDERLGQQPREPFLDF